MKKLICIFGLGFFGIFGYSQVGIGTVTPTAASMLEVSSTSDNGTNYKGLMPPRVPTVTERDAINATIYDAGLLVFVQDISCLQIWNGISWEDIHCNDANIVPIAMQDFDSNTSWTFTHNPPFYNNTTLHDIWDIVDYLGPGTSSIDLVSGNFLGCRDLNNADVGSGGGDFFHYIIFDPVDVSALTNPTKAFDYDVFEFDIMDDVEYEVFYDGVGQGTVLFIEGNSDYSQQGTHIINVPNGTVSVSFTLGVRQNSHDDFAGFDNFIVYGQQ